MGGYYKNADITDGSLRNIRLPEKIRCSKCSKFKAPSNFAKKRLNELREKIRDNDGPFTVQCTVCTPQQVTELTCYMCGKDKGLEEFAKAQRKKPDHAKCNGCMKEQLEFEAVEDKHTYHGEVLGNSDSDDYDDSDDDEYSGFGDGASTFAESSSRTGTGNLIGSFDDLSVDDSASTGTGVAWTPVEDRSRASGSRAGASAYGARTSSYAASVSSNSTVKNGSYSPWGGNFDPKKYGHPGSSVADSMETNRPSSSKSSGWAKIKAFKQTPQPKQEEEEDVWGDVDEEESSSDEEESDDEYTLNKGKARHS
ncbi:Meiotic chromosome segregation protein [Lasiodiplodia theobromae]|uniref:Meiotic chromosome segregation protein n=1 Tax=Lasiodiplodia theobromae TaxID=45133 RepID=A0A5N5DTY6_9PEZI|nr:Meiotic chromosome segregation protein [Lasiodiplodia theobromae]